MACLGGWGGTDEGPAVSHPVVAENGGRALCGGPGLDDTAKETDIGFDSLDTVPEVRCEACESATLPTSGYGEISSSSTLRYGGEVGDDMVHTSRGSSGRSGRGQFPQGRAGKYSTHARRRRK